MHLIIENWLIHVGLEKQGAATLSVIFDIAALVVLIILANWLAHRFLVPVVERTIRRTANKLDDILIENRFFHRLAQLLPVVAAYVACDVVFPDPNLAVNLTKRLVLIFLVLVSLRAIDAFLNSVHDIYRSTEISKGKPVRGYIQALKIFVYVLAGILIIAIATNKSPLGIITVFGGLTAVLILVFKDTLLGFVASIQLATNDMLRVGDWIEMPKYGADGDVIDISINTIKVRNWDKTIATIPTYALVSDSFKNWRGMSESGGRRIKRSVFIDMNSIKFCSDAMLERFGKIHLLKEYLETKKEEIAAYNAERKVDTTVLINGRRQTNVGVFRAYVIAYLRQHPKIHQNMTFLVRQLQSTPQGLPIEIYVFSNDQVWANYEAIQADIFDHILAAITEFDLRVYQYPSGYDFLGITNR